MPALSSLDQNASCERCGRTSTRPRGVGAFLSWAPCRGRDPGDLKTPKRRTDRLIEVGLRRRNGKTGQPLPCADLVARLGEPVKKRTKFYPFENWHCPLCEFTVPGNDRCATRTRGRHLDAHGKKVKEGEIASARKRIRALVRRDENFTHFRTAWAEEVTKQYEVHRPAWACTLQVEIGHDPTMIARCTTCGQTWTKDWTTRIRQGVRCNNFTAEMCTTTRDERILEGINAKNAIKNAIREWSRARTRLLSTLRKRGVALDGSCGPPL